MVYLDLKSSQLYSACTSHWVWGMSSDSQALGDGRWESGWGRWGGARLHQGYFFLQGAPPLRDYISFFKYLSIFGYAGSLLLHLDFSLVAAIRGYSPVVVLGLLTAMASLVVEHGL